MSDNTKPPRGGRESRGGRGAAPSNAPVQEVLLGVGLDARTRRPRENALSEGNLSELPLFVLSPKEAKPLDKNGMANPADYTRHVELAAGPDGVPRHLEINASVHHGFPTMFANRVLIAIITRAQDTHFTSPVVNINRYEIARALGYAPKDIGRNTYEAIDNALEAMRAVEFTFTNSWYNKGKRSSMGPIMSTAGLIEKFDFPDARLERQQELTLGLPPSEERSYVRLSQLLHQSLADRYFHGVDLNYLNALKTPLAERLYVYLAKKDGEKKTYAEGIAGLALKLNLKKKAIAHVVEKLEPALQKLSTPLVLDLESGKVTRQFLKSFNIDRPTKMMHVAFYTPLNELLGR